MAAQRITISIASDVIHELERLASLHPLLNKHAIAATALSIGVQHLGASACEVVVGEVSRRRSCIRPSKQ